jgi:hypothetical protein
MSSSVNREKSHKRHYRQQIICETCKKLTRAIAMLKKCTRVKKWNLVFNVHQPQLSNFFASSAKPPKRSMPDMKNSESVSCSPISSTHNTYCHFPHPVDEDITSNMSWTSSYVQDITPCQSSAIASKVQDPRENVTPIEVSNFNLQDSTDDFASTQPSPTSFNMHDSTENLIIDNWSNTFSKAQDSRENVCHNQSSSNSSNSSFNLQGSRADLHQTQSSIPSPT